MALKLEDMAKKERTAEDIEAEVVRSEQATKKLKGMLAKLKKQGE